MRVETVDFVTVPTRDMARARRFYGDVLGLPPSGTNPDAQQKGGFTPLHEAAHTDDAEMARLLLDAGADPSIEADDGRDSAKLAADDGSAGVQALLSG